MDISKAGDFERFVFDLLGRDGARTHALFGNALAKLGYFSWAPTRCLPKPPTASVL